MEDIIREFFPLAVSGAGGAAFVLIIKASAERKVKAAMDELTARAAVTSHALTQGERDVSALMAFAHENSEAAAKHARAMEGLAAVASANTLRQARNDAARYTEEIRCMGRHEKPRTDQPTPMEN